MLFNNNMLFDLSFILALFFQLIIILSVIANFSFPQILGLSLVIKSRVFVHLFNMMTTRYLVNWKCFFFVLL